MVHQSSFTTRASTARPLAIKDGGWLPYDEMVAALAREENRPDNNGGQSMAQLACTELKNTRLGPNLLGYKPEGVLFTFLCDLVDDNGGVVEVIINLSRLKAIKFNCRGWR